MAAGSEGTMRFQNESLAVDYPADWYSAWLEDPYAKTALFTSFDVGDAAAFLTSGGPPVLGAGQTLAAILIDPEEAGPDDVKKQLEDAAASWGPDAKILERGATIIAGMPGTWLSVNAKTASAAGMRVYLAGASGARAGTILFVGLSPADDVAKAQTQFTAILRSIELPRH
jgi:hypothetical protein